MRLWIFITFLYSGLLFSQTKVAILDFENTSGIAKYDGFGKALSNMLITDLKNTIHPRKVVFLERSQLNKILDEQKLQKTKSFDQSTAVSFGKLAGVNFVLVGSVYVLDGKCVINSRFVDVQTSEIVHSKESIGDIKDWLQLKTTLAEELSKAMSNPVTIDTEYNQSQVTEGVLVQYAKVIGKIDDGEIEEAQEMTEMLSAVQPDFKYFNELQSDIDLLKKELEALKEKVDEAVEKPLELALDLWDRFEYEKSLLYIEVEEKRLLSNDHYYENKKLFLNLIRSGVLSDNGQYEEALKIQSELLHQYPHFVECRGHYVITMARKGLSEAEIKKQFDFFIDHWAEFGSQEIAESSDFLHEYVDLGRRWRDKLVYGYFDAVDRDLDHAYFGWVMGQVGKAYINNGKVGEGLDLIERAIDLVSDNRPNWSYTFYVEVVHDLLTSLSWYSAAQNELKRGMQYYEKYGVTYNNVMSVVNFGHIYLLNGNEEEANDLYCWAIQNNRGEFARLPEIIKQDWKDLNINADLDLVCDVDVLITDHDKERALLKTFLTEKSIYSSGDWKLTFLGDGKCEITLNEEYSGFNDNRKTLIADLKIDYSSPWIRFDFNESVFLPFGGYRNQYHTFKMNEEGRTLNGINDKETIFIRK